MNAVDYLTNLLLLGIVVAGFWVSARSLARLLLGGWRGAPALLGQVVLALSVAVVTCEALGLVGLLNAPALLSAATLTAAGLRFRRPETVGGRGARALPAGHVGFGLAEAAAPSPLIHSAGPVLHSLDVGIYRQDSTWCHLPFSACSAQTGSIGGLLL